MFTKWPIDSVTDNSAERLKVSLTKQLLDNRIYDSNPRNDNLNDLPFDGDESLINIWWLYRKNNNIIFRLINGLSVYVKKIECNKNKILVRCIYQLKIEPVHKMTKISKDRTILLTFFFDICMIAQQWIGHILCY